MEIERKYLIDEIPFDLKDYSCKVIEQGYLNTDPVVRVRRSNDKYILTYKGSGLMVREEYNLPLNEKAYRASDSKSRWYYHFQEALSDSIDWQADH